MPSNPLKNPFIVLGVSSDAGMSEIKAIARRSLMALRLDDDADPAEIKRIEDALETLADPVARFELGLFAPELTADEQLAFREDPILSTLGSNPTQDAVEAYKEIAASENVATQAHNYGVLRFFQAVASTQEAQKGTPDDISDDLACLELWKDAYKNLRFAFSADEYWITQRLRAKSYDDKRLSPEKAQQIQRNVYSHVVAPVGDVIRLALLERHPKVAKAYVHLVRESDFEETFLEEVLANVYKPLADRVEREITSLQQELRNGDELDSHYKKLLKRFKGGAAYDIQVMLHVGDLPGYAEEHARDTAASFLRELSIGAFNNADDLETAKVALKFANAIVDSQSDKERYKSDLEQIVFAEKFNPYRERFEAYLEEGDLEAALEVVSEMIEKGGDEDGQLVALKRSLSSSLATQLFNQGLAAAKSGDKDTALLLLRQARGHESDLQERVLIDRGIRAVAGMSSGSKSGCLVAAFQLLPYVVLAGIAGGALYACSH